MTELDIRINEAFPGLVVRKDLTKIVKGNAIVPTYVLEYLLGQYCATDDDNTIETGITRVKDILSKHYVHRSEAELVKSTIKEKGRHKIIDKVTVELNDKAGVYEATFSNLGIKKVLVETDYVKKHPKLLVGGVWCIADMVYEASEDPKQAPWSIDTLKPIQISSFDYEGYCEARKRFSSDEWIDVLMQSIGLNPEMFGHRNKLLQLVRLIPYCERNYNVIELGPKGTGKSHIYSEFSPHGILISGGEVSVPKLFVNNSNGKLGLVGYWDTVAFDEFAGKDKKVDKSLVDIMKNYMANKTFSRGIETLGAEASMAFMGNTRRSLAYMMKHADLFTELPAKYYDTAFLDRLHFYIPGWEIDIIRGEMFTSGYGFIVDYLAEILKKFRNDDFSHLYTQHFELHADISTRDRDAIHKTFSGLMKILFPNQDASKEEVENLLKFSIEGRKRIKDQLLKIDETYNAVNFTYRDLESGESHEVSTLEETQYPHLAKRRPEASSGTEPEARADEPVKPDETLESGKHVVVQENQKGISYEGLFAPYLVGASQITINDPYIVKFYQAKNLMELLRMILTLKPEGDEIDVKLVTKSDMDHCEDQEKFLEQIRESLEGSGLNFEFSYDTGNSMHARSIVTDTGWKLSLDRGLDIFQPYDFRNAFDLANTVQEERQCKAFEVTYLKVG